MEEKLADIILWVVNGNFAADFCKSEISLCAHCKVCPI